MMVESMKMDSISQKEVFRRFGLPMMSVYQAREEPLEKGGQLEDRSSQAVDGIMRVSEPGGIT